MSQVDESTNTGTNDKQADVIMFTMPAMFEVTARGGLTGVINLTMFDATTIQAMLNAHIQKSTRNASCGMKGETAAKKFAKEKVKFDEFLDGTWTAGKTGTREGNITDERQAVINAIFEKLTEEGWNKTAATKGSKAKDGWNQYFLTAMSRAQNRENVSAEEVTQAIEANKPLVDKLVADQLALIIKTRETAKDTGFDLGNIAGTGTEAE